MLTVEELLRPRYKLIADYPGCEFEVGQIIEFTHKSNFFTGEPEWTTDMVKNKHGHSQFCIKLIEPGIPHLFQPLQWWECRDVTDMPEYFKVADNLGAYIGSAPRPVYKIGVGADWNIYKEHVIGVKYKTYGGTMIDFIIPCTVEEYTSYINQKKQ